LPTIILIAGPNGAGKTTFAREYLAADDRPFEFVNADEIARTLETPSDILAARIMLARIDGLISARADLVIETTLSSLVYARLIPKWRERGYLISLTFLRLDSVEDALDRVRRRVQAGGHQIPDRTVKRRFLRGLANFQTIYRPLVDEWYVWRSGEGFYWLMESWNGQPETRP
jgi:predicted ABC-type ATPase